MNKIKIILTLLVVLCISCSKKNKAEQIFISSKKYYWQYNNECFPNDGLGTVNFQFGDDGYSHQFSLRIDKGYISVEGEVVSPKKWLLKNDSTLIWNAIEYKIYHIDRRIIILEYKDPRDQNKLCYIRLLKVADAD